MNQASNQQPATGIEIGQIAISELPTEMLLQIQAELKRREALKPNPIKEYQDALEAKVPQMAEIVKEASDYLTTSKLKIFTIAKELLEMKYQAYGVKSARSKYLDEQRQHSFTDKNDNTITVGFNITEGWGSEVDIGVEKINSFLNSLVGQSTEGLTGEALVKAQQEADKVQALVDLIFSLLRKNKHGNIKLSSVAKLEGMIPTFNNAEFTEGVNIIKNSFKPQKTVWFIEASGKNGINEKVNYPLSMTAAPFPDDFDFDFLPKRDPAAT